MSVLSDIEARFRSGNSVSVERIHITAAEWAELKPAIDAIPVCLAIMESARPLVLNLERLKTAAQ